MSGQVNLNRLMAVYDLVDRTELKYAPFAPSIPERLRMGSDIFSTLRAGDVLLHHPFQGFGPVTDFIKQAASDPQVLAIKQTLYRAGSDSTIVDALAEAAQAGKDVTVIIELRARFDEEANIDIATKLQEAGAHVMYGVFGFKTHAKLVMVVRREEKGLRRYCHLGTGNYHRQDRAALHRLRPDDGRRIDRRGHPRDIPAVDRTDARASPAQAAACAVQLASSAADQDRAGDAPMRDQVSPPASSPSSTRSPSPPSSKRCTGLRAPAWTSSSSCAACAACGPAYRGVSERIKVRSIVGRFLEHSRVYYFENGGEREIYCGSADWMDRNLFRRIEVAFPVEAPAPAITGRR